METIIVEKDNQEYCQSNLESLKGKLHLFK